MDATIKTKQIARGQRGMTLLEIMVVIVIIAMVTGVVGVKVMDSLATAQRKTALTQIKSIEEAMELYKLSHHRYPSSAEGINALTTSTQQEGALMKEVPKDPWDKDYVYIFPGTHNTDSFDIYSYGPDGAEGGGDDVANWK